MPLGEEKTSDDTAAIVSSSGPTVVPIASLALKATVPCGFTKGCSPLHNSTWVIRAYQPNAVRRALVRNRNGHELGFAADERLGGVTPVSSGLVRGRSCLISAVAWSSMLLFLPSESARRIIG